MVGQDSPHAFPSNRPPLGHLSGELLEALNDYVAVRRGNSHQEDPPAGLAAGNNILETTDFPYYRVSRLKRNSAEDATVAVKEKGYGRTTSENGFSGS